MENLVIIPEKELKAILNNQKKSLSQLESLSKHKPQGSFNFKYIPEDKAKELLGKKTTWFWKQRTEGKISYSKVGNTIFYLLSDIEKLLDDNFNETF